MTGVLCIWTEVSIAVVVTTIIVSVLLCTFALVIAIVAAVMVVVIAIATGFRSCQRRRRFGRPSTRSGQALILRSGCLDFRVGSVLPDERVIICRHI